MSSTEVPYQVSEKAGDAIIVVRGEDYADFVNNVAMASDADFATLIGGFSANIKSLAPAFAAVKKAFPAATVESSTPGSKHSCPHGDRTFRDGKTWAAWFCPAKVCKPVDDKTGELWK